MKILAWDLSFRMTGYVILENSKILKMGAFSLTGNSTGQKLNCLYKTASKLIVENEPDIIAAEDVFPSRKTMNSYRPLIKLQSIIELLAFRLNRSRPITAFASEVRSTFNIDPPKKMKKDFDQYAKKMRYKKTESKAKLKRRYADFKKACIVKKVNELYPDLKLRNSDHDIADAVLLALHAEKVCV